MKPRSILLFIAATLFLLAILCIIFPRDGIDLGFASIQLPTLQSLVPKQQEAPAPPIEPIPARDLSELNDSIEYYSWLVDSSDLRLALPSEHYLDPFWENIERAKTRGRIVRIVHYGDSQIEMDRITSRLRSYMQATFGGGGPGMIPFRTLIPSYAVRQSTHGRLTHLASFGDSTVVRSKGNYGPMMQSFRLRGTATADVKASTVSFVDERVKRFSSVKLIFNNIGSRARFNATPSSSDSSNVRIHVLDGPGCVEWRFDSAITHFQVRASGQVDLYGMLVDNGPGVAVDNIPMRGCSGTQFTLTDEELLRSSYRKMDIVMIILQFGGNTVPYIDHRTTIESYCNRVGEQIDHIHRCCPQARILFVGPSDMSTRRNGTMQTYPNLPELIDSLEATVLAHGAAYWSIYHAMGGMNSMPQWVDKGWAGKDYIHFSQHGADLMGDRMAEALANSYELFCLRRRMNNEMHSAQ